MDTATDTRATPPWHRALLPAAILCAAVALLSPWQMVDPDALSHLAIGRAIVQGGAVPTFDPLTFSHPQALWSNPEWGGDALLYLLHRATGEGGLIGLKIAVLCVGFLLVLQLGRRQGAATTLVLLLLLFALVGAPGRFTLRNHIHAYWLVPLYGLILARGQASRPWLLLLIPAGVLWANLHGSFPLGWIMIAAALCQALLEKPTDRRALLALGGILVLHPLLAMISPLGPGNYGQLLDHLLGAPVYRQLILEWQPPGQAASLLTPLPLHILGVSGLLSFLPRVNRRQIGALLLLVAGLSLAHTSQRFIPLLAVLAAPGVAANLTRWLEQRSPRPRRLIQAGAWILCLGLLLPVIHGARTDVRPHVLARPDAPIKTARFLARAAPEGSRLFNPFNAGPWLLWTVTPRTRLYIDPRNNLGAEALRRYIQELLPDPSRFEREAKRLRINLALTDLSDGRMTALNLHLRRSEAWRLIYWEGHHALYALVSPINEELIRAHGYRTIEASLDLDYLLAGPEAGSERPRATELQRLRVQSAAAAEALEGFLLLAGSGPPPKILTASSSILTQARSKLEWALPRLPPSAALMSYLVTAWARKGNLPAAAEVLAVGQAHFRGDPHLMACEAELARVRGEAGRRTELLTALRGAAPHLWRIIKD